MARVPGKYDVRPAGKSCRMQAEAQAPQHAKPRRSSSSGLVFLASDPAHVVPALLGGKHIHCQATSDGVASATICRSVAAISGTVMPGRSVTAPEAKASAIGGDGKGGPASAYRDNQIRVPADAASGDRPP